MHFDKTSLKKRNPQQQKISRNATKTTGKLCGKNAQLATLKCGATPTIGTGSEPFYCYVITTNSRRIHSQVGRATEHK